LGIQQAMKQLYSMEHSGRELKNRMLEVAENWRPYRSIVCKYLWQWKSL
jgi:DNA-3-methyladenine glycosylase II